MRGREGGKDLEEEEEEGKTALGAVFKSYDHLP